MKKSYVAVRAAYYKHDKLTKQVKSKHIVEQSQDDGSIRSVIKTKVTDKSYKSAIAEFEHVLRTGSTNSVNVIDKYSNNNAIVSPSGTCSPLDAYYKHLERYKKTVGRKCRNDMNTLMEHIVVLSEEHTAKLEDKLGKERAKREIVKCLKTYSKMYAERFKFTECGFALHLDEGFTDSEGNFKRNIHAHVMFFNYDFDSKKSYLRTLFKKGDCNVTGKTNELNSNFVAIQDLAHECFKRLKYSRGRSKLLTMSKYLPKHQFLERKLQASFTKYKKITRQLNQKKNELSEYLEKWLRKILEQESAKTEASISAEIVLDIDNSQIREGTEKMIGKLEKDIQDKTQVSQIGDEDLITNHIKQKINSRKKK